MKNINITKEEYEHLLEDNISRGEEGAVSWYKGNLVKVFFKEGATDTIDYQIFREKLENKRNKINILMELSQREDFENNLYPSGIVSYNNHFCGYILSNYIDSNLYNIDKKNIGFSDKISILKQYKRILDNFHTYNIVYGDIKSKNLLISNDYSTVAFGDLDNVKIGSFPIDKRPVRMVDFCNQYYGLTFDIFMTGIIDSYMFNLLTLEFLMGYSTDDYQPVFDYLFSSFNNSSLFDSVEDNSKIKIKSICEELKNINSCYSGNYIVDQL